MKLDVLSLREEKIVLTQEECEMMSPNGIYLKLRYFCACNFMIKGYNELKATIDDEIYLYVNEYDEYLM